MVLSRENEFIALMLVFGHIKLLQSISTKLNFSTNSGFPVFIKFLTVKRSPYTLSVTSAASSVSGAKSKDILLDVIYKKTFSNE